MYKLYKLSEAIEELQFILDNEGDMQFTVNTINCKEKGWNFTRPFIEIDTDGEGTVYINGKYCVNCKECDFDNIK